MKVFLATKLQEYTRNLRNNEEGYIKKYQELCGGTDITGKFSQVLKTSEFGISVSNPTDPQAFLQIENSNDILKKRDTEINNLVNSLNDLTTVMKDLQSLVFEQGTILDRIDFNIEQAFDHHKKANVDLKISEENLKSGCARNSIIFLIILIFVLGICVLIKFTK